MEDLRLQNQAAEQSPEVLIAAGLGVTPAATDAPATADVVTDAGPSAGAVDAATPQPAGTDQAAPVKPVTLADVQAAIAADRKAQAKSAAREAYIAAKMSTVPRRYLDALGDDPAKFSEQEQAIRTELKADLARLGVKPQTVAGGSPGGTSHSLADFVPTSTATPEALIQQGLAGRTRTPGPV